MAVFAVNCNNELFTAVDAGCGLVPNPAVDILAYPPPESQAAMPFPGTVMVGFGTAYATSAVVCGGDNWALERSVVSEFCAVTFTPLVLTTDTGLCPATIVEVVPLVNPVVADCRLLESFFDDVDDEEVGRAF